jgi:hypothetical protein
MRPYNLILASGLWFPASDLRPQTSDYLPYNLSPITYPLSTYPYLCSQIAWMTERMPMPVGPSQQ